ncbi:uncharacterized protein G2W53_003248 [Senna tora]|uniref:Uncharacterized protein n=1 Tax=Senna tora TaxID=362788 RepID=A0A834XA87_9FABA|nr:uncharacterized protein G2W53_003248 [Senna tora]
MVKSITSIPRLCSRRPPPVHKTAVASLLVLLTGEFSSTSVIVSSSIFVSVVSSSLCFVELPSSRLSRKVRLALWKTVRKRNYKSFSAPEIYTLSAARGSPPPLPTNRRQLLANALFYLVQFSPT